MFFKVIRIWKEEDVLLDKAFKATVSVDMAAWLFLKCLSVLLTKYFNIDYQQVVLHT